MFRLFKGSSRRFTEGGPSFTIEELKKAFQDAKVPAVTWGNVMSIGAALSDINVCINGVVVSSSESSVKAIVSSSEASVKAIVSSSEASVKAELLQAKSELVQVGSDIKVSVTEDTADLKVKTILLQRDVDSVKTDVTGLKSDVGGLKADVNAGFERVEKLIQYERNAIVGKFKKCAWEA